MISVEEYKAKPFSFLVRYFIRNLENQMDDPTVRTDFFQNGVLVLNYDPAVYHFVHAHVRKELEEAGWKYEITDKDKFVLFPITEQNTLKTNSDF